MAARNSAAARRASHARWTKVRKAEATFGRSLRQVAKQIGQIVRGVAPDGVVHDVTRLTATLEKYAVMIEPWAEAVAARMFAEVDRRDYKAWREHSQEVGRALEHEIKSTPTGALMRKLHHEQVDLITSLPRKAGERVQKLTHEAIVSGERAKSISKEIMRTEEVTKSRADLIARTEVAKTASMLTQARSDHLGLTHYIWRTSNDGNVRDAHAKMEGKLIEWAKPPTLSDGTTTHAGQIYNCRCWPEPVLPAIDV